MQRQGGRNFQNEGGLPSRHAPWAVKNVQREVTPSQTSKYGGELPARQPSWEKEVEGHSRDLLGRQRTPPMRLEAGQLDAAPPTHRQETREVRRAYVERNCRARRHAEHGCVGQNPGHHMRAVMSQSEKGDALLTPRRIAMWGGGDLLVGIRQEGNVSNNRAPFLVQER